MQEWAIGGFPNVERRWKTPMRPMDDPAAFHPIYDKMTLRAFNLTRRDRVNAK